MANARLFWARMHALPPCARVSSKTYRMGRCALFTVPQLVLAGSVTHWQKPASTFGAIFLGQFGMLHMMQDEACECARMGLRITAYGHACVTLHGPLHGRMGMGHADRCMCIARGYMCIAQGWTTERVSSAMMPCPSGRMTHPFTHAPLH